MDAGTVPAGNLTPDHYCTSPPHAGARVLWFHEVMTENRNLWSRLSQQPLLTMVAMVTLVYGAMLGITGAFAAVPRAQQVVVAPQPGVSCSDLTPGADGTFVFQCTLVGLVPAATPTGSPSASTTPSATPSVSATPSTTASSSTSPTVTPSPSTSSTTTQPPTPTPTVTTPRPTNTQNGCISNPGACAFPDAASTGPTSPPLVILNGNQTFSTPGQTVANTRINGCVEVRGANITFRNVLFNGNGCFYAVRNFSTGLQVFDGEATCGGANGTAFVTSNLSLTRVDIHDCENGLSATSNISVQDSWIHNMVTANGAHTDGMQINQGATNITFRHNTVVVPAPGGTSAIISWNEGNPQQQNVAIDRNLLSGGTYTLYCPREGTSDTRVTNNRFGVHQFGFSERCTGSHVSAWSGNVVDATGAILAAA